MPKSKTPADIQREYGIRIHQWKYLDTILHNAGLSNDKLAAMVNVSPQLVGRETTRLEKLGLIRDLNESSALIRRQWVAVNEEPAATICSYLHKRP